VCQYIHITNVGTDTECLNEVRQQEKLRKASTCIQTDIRVEDRSVEPLIMAIYI